MKQFLANQIDSISGLEEKKIFRDILEKTLLGFCEDIDNKISSIENRVQNELQMTTNDYTVYSTLLSRKKYDEFAPWLFPVVDKTELQISRDTQFEKGFIIDTIYFESDYLTCRKVLYNSEIFTGYIEIGGYKHRVNVCLKPSQQYLNKIIELYQTFITNGIRWETLNVPYIFKMFDIVLAESITIDVPKEDNVMIKHDITFHDYEKYINKELAPVWNIAKRNYKSEGFPVALIDNKVYEYRFDIPSDGISGYLVDTSNLTIIDFWKDKDTYVVTTSKKYQNDFTFFLSVLLFTLK